MNKITFNTKHFKALALTLCLLIGLKGYCAKVDTVTTHSAAMNRDIKSVVITPDGYNDSKQNYPVVYLLHGYSDSYKSWVSKVPSIINLADQYHVIIVCPDGGYAGWYLDSPEKPKMRYETYISSELVKWTDEHYRTVANRKGRAVTGLSMGGHGALYLAFKHQDVYSIAGSMSGAVDILPISDGFGLPDLLGSQAEYLDRWEQHSDINLVHLLKPNSLAIIIQDGTEDFLYKENVKLHEKLLYRGIPHTFTLSPGGHTWEFWANAIKYQMLFISDQFKAQEKKK